MYTTRVYQPVYVYEQSLMTSCYRWTSDDYNFNSVLNQMLALQLFPFASGIIIAFVDAVINDRLHTI